MKYTTLSLSLSLLLTATSSLAKDNLSELEVIEVRAQKRVQSIQDVPLSVTALGAEQIDKYHLLDSYQLGAMSPNVLVSENAGVGTPAAVSIRGVGLLDYNTSNTSPIGFYFDEAANGSVNTQFAQLFDMQRVEILRGPQGTLFGRNTSGGAVLFYTNPPEDEFGGYVRTGIGTDEFRRVESVLNLPVNDQHKLRFSALHSHSQYSATNNLDQAENENLEQNFVRAQYLYDTDTWKLNIKLNASDWSGKAQPYGHTGVYIPETRERCSTSDALSGVCTDLFGFNDNSDDFRDVSVDNDQLHDTDQIGGTFRLEWDLQEQLTLTAITSFNRLDRQHTTHCDASSLQVCEGHFGLDNNLVSQEVRLQGTQDKHQWIVGVFYLDETLNQDNSIDLLRQFRAVGPASGAAQYFYDNDIDTNSIAVFAQDDIQLTDKLTLTAGLRYTKESTDFNSITHVNTPTANNVSGISNLAWDVEDEIKLSRWLSKLAVVYEIDKSWNTYASFSSGFKSGGFNGGFLFSPEQAQQARYEPEYVDAYEIGIKGRFWQSRATLSLTGFYYDYRDKQVFINQPSSIPGAPNLQLLKNANKSKVSGLESEFKYQLTPEISIFTNIGFMSEFEFGQYVDPTGQELTGNALPFTPEWQGSAGASWDFYQDGQGVWNSNVLLRSQSEIYFDQNQNPLTRQAGYSVWDASLSYQRNHWKIGLFAKNIFDREYDTLRFDLIDFLGLVNSNKGEGRRVSLEFHWLFSED